jgi:hypothetical protein
MMIRTTAKSVYYPISDRKGVIIRGSARVRYIHGSLLVNAKCLKSREKRKMAAAQSIRWTNAVLSPDILLSGGV